MPGLYGGTSRRQYDGRGYNFDRLRFV